MPEAAPVTSTRPIDPVIRPLVNNLNRLPGLTTTSSCQGHYDRRRPHVAFTCDADTLRLILKAATMLNSEEPRQVRAYVEILDYDGTSLDLVLRFHHLFLRVRPKRDTVLEWHRRINRMNELVEAEIGSGFLKTSEARAAFRP